MRGVVTAVMAIAVVSTTAYAVVKAHKCPDGQIVVDGPLLAVTPLPSRADAIAIAGRTVSIASGCEAHRAKFTRTRKGTRLRARWRRCGDVARVRLRGVIDKDCKRFTGTFVAKGLSEKTLAALFEPTLPPALNDGLPVTATFDCGSSTLLDAVETLCSLFGVSPCVSQSHTCLDVQRQMFAGTRLKDAPIAGLQWNGRGGTSDLMADSLLCTLRELSPELGGPISSTPAAINLGPLGTLSVTQEVGFTSFDRLRERFEGYRRIVVDMPVVGQAQAITQPIVFDKVARVGIQSAGSYAIQFAYGLNVEAEDTEKILSFSPPGFEVATPLGPVTVSPVFTYGRRSAVVAAPYKDGNLANDIGSLFAGQPWKVRLLDLYGTNPGMANTASETTPANFASQRGGWASQLGFGTRGAVLGQASWTPPGSGAITRPDADLTMPRSDVEALPSAYVNAHADVKWPSDPYDLLPSWVASIPFLDPPFAQLSVSPTVEVGVLGELFASISEGADHHQPQEFRFSSRRLSSMALIAGTGAVGLFRVDAGVRISVTADFPFPIGPKTFVDIDKKFPIPLASDVKTGPVATAGAASLDDGGPSFPPAVQALQTFKGFHYGAGAVQDFIDACYAPQELAVQVIPQPQPVPGNKADLLKGAEWPCNICVYTANHPGLDLTSIKQQYEAARISHPEWPPWPAGAPAEWVEVLVPASTTPVWKCNHFYDTGCYDLCAFNPVTQQLTVVKGPDDILPLLPPTPDYDDERALLNFCDYDPPA